MTTINRILDRVSRTSPHALGDETLAGYLLALDGRAYLEITAPHEPHRLPPMCWPADGDTPLLIQPPYHMVYDHYLAAMIAWHQRDFDTYNAAARLFRDAWDDWRAAYRRIHRPPSVEVKL